MSACGEGWDDEVCVCACGLARQIGTFFLAFMIRYPCFSVASLALSLSHTHSFFEKLLVMNKVMWGMQKDSSNPKTWIWKPFDLLFRIRIFISKRMNGTSSPSISWMPSLSFSTARECPTQHNTHSLTHPANPFPTLSGTLLQFPNTALYTPLTL